MIKYILSSILLGSPVMGLCAVVELASYSKKLEQGVKYTFILKNNSPTRTILKFSLGDNKPWKGPRLKFPPDDGRGPQLLSRPIGAVRTDSFAPLMGPGMTYSPGINTAPDKNWVPSIGTVGYTNLYWYQWESSKGLAPGQAGKFSITVTSEDTRMLNTFYTVYLNQSAGTDRIVSRAYKMPLDKLAPEDIDYAKLFKRPQQLYKENPELAVRELKRFETLAKSCTDSQSLFEYLNVTRWVRFIENYKDTKREIIEHLAVNNPECLFASLKYDRFQGSTFGGYFIKPVHYTNTQIYDSVIPILKNPKYKNFRSEYIKLYEKEKARVAWENAAAVTDKEKLLWSVKMYAALSNKKIFVPATYVKGHSYFQGELDKLWEDSPDGDLKDQFDVPIKLLKKSQLSFMTNSQYGTYYLTNNSHKNRKIVKAKVVGAALARWACSDIVSLLELEPETIPDWLYSKSKYPHWDVAIETRENLPAPVFSPINVEMFSSSKHPFVNREVERGKSFESNKDFEVYKPRFSRVTWPDSNRSYLYIDYIELPHGFLNANMLELKSVESLVPIHDKPMGTVLVGDHRC